MLLSWLLVAATVATQATPIGQVETALDSVSIRRGPTTYRAGINSALQEGDIVSTGMKGIGVLYLAGGQTLYVGPGASIRLESSPAGRVVHLDRGEMRATGDSRNVLTVAAGGGRLAVGRSIVRAATAPGGGLRVWAEQGGAEVVRAAGPVRLAEGQEVVVPPSGAAPAPSPAKPDGWAIRIEDVQLASASASSRRLIRRRVTDANNALASAVDASGQLGPEQEDLSTRPGAPGTPGPAEQPIAEAQPNTPGQQQPDEAYQNVVLAQPNTGVSATTISLALGGISASQAGGVSGGLFSDAQQDSRNLAFPGNIHLITAQSSYQLNDIRLRPSDNFPTLREYWSIGVGSPTTQQVVTTFKTGTGVIPQTVRILHFNAYLVNLTQFGIPDPATTNPSSLSRAGITGLLGPVPVAPQVRGAMPLTDPRSVFNDRATFALGEFALDRASKGNITNPVLDIRRSDQDRQIIKAPNGNDAQDKITPNPDVKFTDASDRKFFPELASVKVPVQNSMRPLPTYRSLDLLRRAAATTLLADSLSGYVKRTGQTRFVVDHQVIDITGYHKASATSTALLRASATPYGQDTTRPGVAAAAARHRHR